MNCSTLVSGTSIANEGPENSAAEAQIPLPPHTIGDLLCALKLRPPRAFAMLKTTAALLVAYKAKNDEQLTLAEIHESRSGFRSYLLTRKYANNSIRTYVNCVRMLLSLAESLGWAPRQRVIPKEWREVLEVAEQRQCTDIAEYISHCTATPGAVTVEDVDRWVELRVQDGVGYVSARREKGRFWRILRECGHADIVPISFQRERGFGVPLEHFPPDLKKEVNALLAWKKVAFAVGRPKGARVRETTAKQLAESISCLLGFATKVHGLQGISSLPQLFRCEVVSAFLEWSINERKVKGKPLQSSLLLIGAALRQHPSYSSIDMSWLKPLLDSVPLEPDSELRKRKASKYLDYAEIEAIPSKIRARRLGHKKSPKTTAILVRDELMIQWLTILPWRQRNLRECRISGSEPNLYKAKIPSFSNIDKPEWVLREERANPEAAFWQFRFNADETKTKVDIHAVLPKQLVPLLEEYLNQYRSELAGDNDSGTLFVNACGTSMIPGQLISRVSELTLRFGGRRVTPHLFRDIFAFTWLKEHPQDYLTLSKILWHSNINTTIRTYGSRFNESSGVCSTEAWLETRASRLTQT